MRNSELRVKGGPVVPAMAAAAALLAVACSSPAADDEAVGVAYVSLAQVPTDAVCLEITVQGVRQVVRSFDTTPGTSPVLPISGLPLGSDQFSAQAFAESCANRSATSLATWISDPVVATVSKSDIAQVTLVMRRNGRADVAVSFQDCATGLVDLGTIDGATYVQPTDMNDGGQVVGVAGQGAFSWRAGNIVALGIVTGGILAVNNRGQVVGTDSAQATGFLWSEGVVYEAPTLSGTWSSLQAINEAGQAVGSSVDALNNAHGVLWQPGAEMVDLGTLGGAYSNAMVINASGQVVGSSQTPQGDEHAFLWQGGTMVDLGTLGGNWSGGWLALNDAGQIVGQSLTAAGQTHAFLWQDGTMRDLGTLGGDWSVPFAINAGGQVVGQSNTGSLDPHAFLWEAGTMRDLGTLGGLSSSPGVGRRALNDAGEVVGSAETAPGELHAFLWKAGTMHDLGSLGVPNTTAVGINAAHQIFGFNVTSSGRQRGFFFDPAACPIGDTAAGGN